MTDDTFEPEGHGAAPPDQATNEVATSVGGRLAGGSEARAASARSSVGVVWQEGEPGHWVIKLSGLPGMPPGEEVAVGRAGASNHSPSISDRTSAAGHVLGISVAWIESPAGKTSAVGRVLWQSFGAQPIDPAATAVAANDNATWVTDPSGVGAIGCEPGVTGLTTGDTLVTWVGIDGHAHGRLYAPADADAAARGGDSSDAPEYASVNAALGDLGPVGAASDGGRRLQVAELRPGTFAVMWLALGDNGLVLRGSLFLTPADARWSGDWVGWTEHPIPEVRLPHGFTGQFSMASSGETGAGLQVTYSGPIGAATRAVLGHIEDVLGEEHADGILGEDHAGELGHLNLAAAITAGGQVRSAAAHAASEHTTGADSEVPPDVSQVQGPASLSNDAKPAQIAVAIAASPDVSETKPIVEAVQDGFAIAWQATGGADVAVQIKLLLYGEGGIPKGPEILLTDNAAAGVAPAMASLRDGVAAAYVRAGDGALIVEAYAGDATEIGQETVVDPGDTNPITEVALGTKAEDEFAVVYVRKYSDPGQDAAGYGSIILQRYAVSTEDGQLQLVPLGRDGEHDGSDGAVQLTVDDDAVATQFAYGRAPAVEGVADGELAIIWVESDGTRETIKGSVLDEDGRQVLRIDLTSLLESAGIAKGTKPALSDTGDGDFLVTWLQPDGDDGGYVVMSALYSESSPGAWLAPGQAVRLKAFDSEPKDYAVAVSSDDDGLSVNVIWRADSSGPGGDDKVYSQRYDIDGQQLGGATEIAKDDVPTGDQQLASDTLAAAGLIDGQIIVVYAEQGSDGDLDLAAHIIDTSAVGETGPGDEAPKAPDISAGNTFSTAIDQETAINVLANEMGAGLTISRINDVPISTASPVDVGCGWVQLREDGWLTVAPDAGYTGQIAFDYTVAGADGADSKGHVVVNVEASDAPAAVALLNQVTAVPENLSTAADLKVADIAMADGELGTDGLSLTGLDAAMFKIVGNALYLKEGIELDFDTKPTLSIEIQSGHGNGYDAVASFTLNVGSATDALALGATSDMFEFALDYGDAKGEHDVIDLGSTLYTTFQQLLDAGALVQAGDDVVVALDPGDPADPHKIILKGVELSALSDLDFKFS